MKIYKIWQCGMVSKIFFTFDDALQWVYDKMGNTRHWDSMGKDAKLVYHTKEDYFMRVVKNKTQFVDKEVGIAMYSIIEVDN